MLWFQYDVLENWDLSDVIRALASYPACDRLGAQERSYTPAEGGGQSHDTRRRGPPQQ
jgi:hypothetical protein